jgi:hypothetical protein
MTRDEMIAVEVGILIAGAVWDSDPGASILAQYRYMFDQQTIARAARAAAKILADNIDVRETKLPGRGENA